MAKKSEKVEGVSTIDINSETRDSGIIVNQVINRRELPLVVVLPEGANKAQVERAKILNAYAYSYPNKWEERKEELLKQLEDLKDAPDPIENPNVKLSVGPKL